MKLRVLLIIPPLDNRWYAYSGNTINPPHLGIAYIGTIIKQEGDTVQIIDGITVRLDAKYLFKILNKFMPDVLGITATTLEFLQATQIAIQAKRFSKKIITILGGVHATLLPLETLQNFSCFDIVVYGEGERTILEVMEKIKTDRVFSEIKGIAFRENGEVKLNPPQDTIANLDDIPFPSWSLFNLNKYSSGYRLFKKDHFDLSIQTKRGCPHRCIFCCRTWGTQIRYRSVENILSEIEYVAKQFRPYSLTFVDETFTENRNKTLQICEEIKKRELHKKIVWKCATRVSDVDPVLLLKMKQAGCYLIFFGTESGDENILRAIKKDITLENSRNAIRWAKDAGIMTSATFVLGWPYETKATIEKTLKFARELDSDYVHFLPLIPFPNTELAKMAEEGIGGLNISNRHWKNYNFAYGGVLELREIKPKMIHLKQIEGYVRFYIRPHKILNFFRFIQITKLFQICLYGIYQIGQYILIKRPKS